MSVIVITTDRAVGQTRSDLQGLVDAVRDFEAIESRLPRTLADLGDADFENGRFDLTFSDRGIELLTAGARDYHCSLSGHGAADLEMKFDASTSLARVKLREAYERGTRGH